ncbi:E3 ubiquitin-protein ligase TRIM56-like [Antedon mediterranea]|uniref:E3 ubiquitin-protein ligase TRIM56-like n=1 Tax=Antedon mediterranea TaxID=105859 RepID=UPI003AF97758
MTLPSDDFRAFRKPCRRFVWTYNKNQSNTSDSVVEINCRLSEGEKKLPSRGLKFCPKPRQMETQMSEFFQDVNKDFLTCSICKEVFNHPKQLKCMHNFCQDCLKPLLQKGTPSKIKCPLCREEIELLVDSVSALEDNVFLRNSCEVFMTAHLDTADVLCSFCSNVLEETNTSRCIECADNLCATCAGTHKLTRITRNHQVIQISEVGKENLVKMSREGSTKTPCQKHPSNHLEFFCQTCQVPVCFACTVVDHGHKNGHDLKDLHDAPTIKTFKDQIIEHIRQLTEVTETFKEHITFADNAEERLILSLETTKKDIKDSSKALIAEIAAYTNRLITKVDKRAETIQKTIEHHRDAAEVKIQSCNSINQFALNICKHGLNAEIMSSAKDLLKRMDDLQEDLDDIGTGELKFIPEPKFRLGNVQECKEHKEYTLLDYYTKKEMKVGDAVKLGPDFPVGDPYDRYRGRHSNGTIQKIKRNGQTKMVMVMFQNGSTLECKMNRNEKWLQPAKPSELYMVM